MASLFGITAVELGKKIAPTADAHQFAVGDGGELSEADALLVIEDAEDEVLAYLPPKYQGLMRRVDGEVALRCAAGGELALVTSLAPVVDGTLQVWVNYPGNRAWSERRPEDALGADEVEVELATGIVTLASALSRGDRVVLTYEHGAASRFRALRKAALDLAAAEVSRRFVYLKGTEGFDRFEQWESSARQFLRDLKRSGGVALEPLERIELASETTFNPAGMW